MIIQSACHLGHRGDEFFVVFDLPHNEGLLCIGHQDGELFRSFCYDPDDCPRLTKEEAMELCKHEGLLELLKRMQ